MDLQKVAKARAEAERFLQKVKEFEKRWRDDPEMRKYLGVCGYAETAAVKRASMDLSRALAKLRKGVGR